MEEVPKMISTKDLSYITDIFNWNFIVAKNAKHYSEEVDDNDIKGFMEDTYEMHKDICQELIDLLSMEDNENE